MWAGEGRLAGVQGGHRRAGRTHNSGPLPWHAQCPRGARRCQTLRHRTFYPSGGCAGTESWKRPFPGSKRQGEDFKRTLSQPGVRPRFHKLGVALEILMESVHNLVCWEMSQETKTTGSRKLPWGPSLEPHIGGLSPFEPPVQKARAHTGPDPPWR